MRKYLTDYKKELEEKVKGKVTPKDIEDCYQKILFFQHERLIHLIVTLFFSLFAICFLALSMVSYVFLIPFASLLIFVLFYIYHYYFLENNVQYLYKLYDQLKAKLL